MSEPGSGHTVRPETTGTPAATQYTARHVATYDSPAFDESPGTNAFHDPAVADPGSDPAHRNLVGART
ncbi:hypothetical protein GCM10023094_34140 [Rhodococcus olei]|uniref:Uncharacterized protein n=1 Tax=Rhodococcus olei TaxID=2161675 RepID=A0ABP8P9U3_9NOCA